MQQKNILLKKYNQKLPTLLKMKDKKRKHSY